MKVTRRLKITVTHHRLASPPPGGGRVFCPACGCEVELPATVAEAPLLDESAVSPPETGLRRNGSEVVTALAPFFHDGK
jgi:hypothetical protein